MTKMTLQTVTAGILSMGLYSLHAQALNLSVDHDHSNIGFDIKHLVVSTVHGNFKKFHGTIDLNESDFTRSSVKFTVKTESINTDNEKRDQHLRSNDFFDVEKFPEATFVSKSITLSKKHDKDHSKSKDHPGKEYVLEGDLTIHGVTRPTQFQLTSLGKVKDPYQTEKYIFQAKTEIPRKDFGLVYNAMLEGGGMVLGDHVHLTIDLEAIPEKVK